MDSISKHVYAVNLQAAKDNKPENVLKLKDVEDKINSARNTKSIKRKDAWAYPDKGRHLGHYADEITDAIHNLYNRTSTAEVKSVCRSAVEDSVKLFVHMARIADSDVTKIRSAFK